MKRIKPLYIDKIPIQFHNKKQYKLSIEIVTIEGIYILFYYYFIFYLLITV